MLFSARVNPRRILTAAMLPKHVIELVTLFLRNVKSVSLIEVEAEPAEASLTVGEELRVEWLQLVLLLHAEITLAHGNGKVGSSCDVVSTLTMSDSFQTYSGRPSAPLQWDPILVRSVARSRVSRCSW